MKILFYVLLAIILLIVAFFFWFFVFHASVPELEIPPSTDKTVRTEKIDRYLAGLQADGKFNGAVLIAREGAPLLMKTYGFTDHTRATKLDTKSSFRLASVSKQFTAAGVLRAQQLGLLEIDNPVNDYLTGFPYAKVTVRHLLNQTSGVPDQYMQLAEAHREEIGDTLSINEVVELMTKYAPTVEGLPGDAYAYSNTGYVLLAAIVEATSGQSFEAFMQSQLFDPLKMPQTRVLNHFSDTKNFPEKTAGFMQLPGLTDPLIPGFLDGVAGDGGVFSSIEDFLIWDEFWNGNNELVADSLLLQAFVSPTLNDGAKSDYGFGWVLKPSGNHWHNGAWLGARTIIKRYPAQKEVIVILDNSDNIRFDKIAMAVIGGWEQ
ncbi:serine hydrolase domain-containing protein [Neolewinella persica]|uniref:serine hydrolase domain-containing protein n=1 Tax=Neolewinella persica TaxID=70998 RepID=UPI000378C26D|nr:serine hydrolase [Neolewinella persica]